MSDNGLYSLYRLHLIDQSMLDLKRKASSLDAGASIAAEIEKLKEATAPEREKYDSLSRENKELAQKIELSRAKAAELEKKLYAGSVVNAKEAAGYETEIKAFKKTADDAEFRQLEIAELMPAAENQAREAHNQLRLIAQKYDAKRKEDMALGGRLQETYKKLASERLAAALEVPKPLLSQYDSIRSKHSGIGMGVINGTSCGACGTNLPTRVIQSVSNDRIVTCESCHRILFVVVPEE